MKMLRKERNRSPSTGGEPQLTIPSIGHRGEGALNAGLSRRVRVQVECREGVKINYTKGRQRAAGSLAWQKEPFEGIAFYGIAGKFLKNGANNHHRRDLEEGGACR